MSFCGKGGGRGCGPRGAKGGVSSSSDAIPVDANADSLLHFFRRVDGANYAQLKSLTASTFAICNGSVKVSFRRVQPDPFAPGSCVDVCVPTPFNVSWVLKDPLDVTRRVAAEDYMHRCVLAGLGKYNRSHAMEVLPVSQHVLARSTVTLSDSLDVVMVKLRVKLPGHGRRIDGRGCCAIFFNQLEPLLQQYVGELDEAALLRHVNSVADQEWLRNQLAANGLVAFVADGAVLPRAAGNCDAPLQGDAVVPFTSPPDLARSFRLPCEQRVLTGMAIPRGLTLIAGGGFHGKSTLLRALELGVYNHVADDGRCFVVVDPTAVKCRAEDRRAVSRVDISPFINNLPNGATTRSFTTRDASGSTSQAANIMEALELGCTTLLIDEDTSATNFMTRDAWMEQLVPAAAEPITPFSHRVRELIERRGISVIMAVGGSGTFFEYADVVLVMSAYRAESKLFQVKEILAAAGRPTAVRAPLPAQSIFGTDNLPRHVSYCPAFTALRPTRGRPTTKVSAVGTSGVRLAEEFVDVSLVEQLVEEGQLNAIAQCLAELLDGGEARLEAMQRDLLDSVRYPSSLRPQPVGTAAMRTDYSRLVENCERRLRQSRLELQSPSCYLPRGFTALPRVFEIGAALNRLRTL